MSPWSTNGKFARNGIGKAADSNVIIYLVNDQLAHPLPVQGFLVSVITRIEVLGYRGLSNQEEASLLALLNDLIVVPLDDDIVSKSIELRKATNLRIPDATIAATALVANVELLTHDQVFSSVPGLSVSAPALK